MIEIHAINPQSVDNTVTLSIGAPDTKGLQLLQSWKRLRKAPDWKAAEYLASSRLGIGASPSCLVLGAWIFGQVCYHLYPFVTPGWEGAILALQTCSNRPWSRV